MSSDERGKLVSCRIRKGGSGRRINVSGEDINYVISGIGKAVSDGIEQILSAGVYHTGRNEYSIINTGDEDLVLLTYVKEAYFFSNC